MKEWVKSVKKIFLLIVFVQSILVYSVIAELYADIVVMNEGEELKGVVVEEYDDRIMLSTIDGEKQVMRKDIKKVIFDLEEQNLTSIGDFYQDNKRFEKAAYYYKRALIVNPNYKKAPPAS